MVAECQHLLKEVRIVCDEHAALTSGDRLGAVKRERSKLAHRTGALSVIDGTYGLCRIFNHGDAMFLADCKQPIHVAQVAIEMNGQDGLGPRCDRKLDLRRVQTP